MKKELPTNRVEGPVRLLGVGEDDANVGVALVRVAPDIEVPVGPVRVFAGLLEPFVLVRGVVERKVDNNAHIAFVRFRHQVLELLQSAEFRQNRAVVGDVVTAVFEGRIEERRNPQGVDAQPLQVVELGNQTGQITGTVSIAVNERANHDFVEDGAAIPSRIEGQTGQLNGCGKAHGFPSVPAKGSLDASGG